MNNIQNLHVVIPHINGEAVNHYVGYEQHTKFTYCYDLMQGLVASAPLLIVGKCWQKLTWYVIVFITELWFSEILLDLLSITTFSF